MNPKYFSLRCEATGDQWWFASPIDCAAANGHCDLVRHLIQIDNSLLLKLTSLSRIRRLETVWDDDDDDRELVARCRSKVAANLLRHCETPEGKNSLIRAGYGGWLLYTAAAAGDLVFVRELLGRDPLLVFGEGEYGVTEIFYAAARGRSGEVFGAVLECCLSAMKGQQEEVASDFRWEVMNRAVHSAARGGSLGILMELLRDGSSDVLAYRDKQGSTVLHSAAGRGQVEVVKNLISSYDVISSLDNQGNTALHVAAYMAHLSAVEALISASPTSVYSTNNYGDTFLHMAVAGFRTPSFRRLDRQIEVLKKLLSGKLLRTDDIINLQNNDGWTPLHVAVVENIQSDVVELIMSVRYIDLNICDREGNTPLDLLNQRPRSASSEILIKRLISAGGVCENPRINDLVSISCLRLHGIGSPGTSFRTCDNEIVLNAGIEDTREEYMGTGIPDFVNYSGAIEVPKFEKLSSMSSLTGGDLFKKFLHWLGKKEKNKNGSYFEEDKLSFKSHSMFSSLNNPVPLREQFSCSSDQGNKRIQYLQGNLRGPSAKKKFLGHDARQVLPKSNLGSPRSGFTDSSWQNLESVRASSLNQSPKKFKMKRKHGSFNLRSVNNYFCLGSHGLAVEKLIKSSSQPPCEDRQRLVV